MGADRRIAFVPVVLGDARSKPLPLALSVYAALLDVIADPSTDDDTRRQARRIFDQLADDLGLRPARDGRPRSRRKGPLSDLIRDLVDGA